MTLSQWLAIWQVAPEPITEQLSNMVGHNLYLKSGPTTHPQLANKKSQINSGKQKTNYSVWPYWEDASLAFITSFERLLLAFYLWQSTWEK